MNIGIYSYIALKPNLVPLVTRSVIAFLDENL